MFPALRSPRSHRRFPVGFAAALALAPLALAPANAYAQFFAGAEASYAETIFRPEYDYAYDRPSSRFKDTAYGIEADLVGGYRFQLAPAFSLGLAGTLGLSDARWHKHSASSNYDLRYAMPGRAFLSLEPSFHLARQFRIFGEIGAGAGYVEQSKTSDTASRYDESRWLWGYRLGGGIGYEFLPGWECSLAFRHSAYESFGYASHLPDGTHWESIRDKPYANGYAVRLTRAW